MMNDNYFKFAFAYGASCGLIFLALLLPTGFIPDVRYFMSMQLIELKETLKEGLLKEREDKSAVSSVEAGVATLRCETLHIVLPFSIDRNRHMNNSTYIYELNFARRNLFNVLRLWPVLRMHSINLVIQAQNIRYRKELKLWQRYRITSTIVAWDDNRNVFYIESKFESLDSFVLAIHHAKYKVVVANRSTTPVGVDVGGSGNRNIKWTPSLLLQEAKLWQANFPAPAVPSSIRLWEEANDCSSKELNPAKKKVVVS